MVELDARLGRWRGIKVSIDLGNRHITLFDYHGLVPP